LPFGTEAYTITDIIPGKETSHFSETTAITPLVKGISLVADAVTSSYGDCLSTGIGYSGKFPLGTFGSAFYLPFTTGEGSTLMISGMKPINNKISLEGFYAHQFLNGDDFYWGEIQGNYGLTKNLDALLTGVFTPGETSLKFGIRLK